jgi:DNA-binding transcriptional LysR family regulator
VDIELARTFVEIVKTRSFVRAAEQLNVTQTTVSSRIRALEEQLGRPLFIRNKSGASLTRRCSCRCGSGPGIRSPCRRGGGHS